MKGSLSSLQIKDLNKTKRRIVYFLFDIWGVGVESLASSLQISTKRLIWLRAKSTSSSSQCSLLKGTDNKTIRISGILILLFTSHSAYAQWYMRVQKVKLKVFKKLLFNAFSTSFASF